MTTAIRTDPLRVCILGMDDRSLSTFKKFLQGPCQNFAIPVHAESAEISLVDLDGRGASELLAKEQEQNPGRPIIVVSLRSPGISGAIHVSKPVKAAVMMAAFREARMNLSRGATGPERLPETSGHLVPETNHDKPDSPVELDTKKRRGGLHRRRSTHHTAMLLDERAYSNFVGVVADINIKDPHQVAKAHYDKKKYLQAFVESAVKLARTRKRILQLNCGWKPITIFPHSNEIWIDADDRQIRSFCVVPIHSILDLDLRDANENPRSIIAPVSLDRINADRDPKKFQSIDAFIWKIALWTSNGRVPDGIQLDQPVYLERWPNLTRFVIIPHALRIAALLTNQPMTLIEVAETLAIRQQYVFSFFSAAMALGLAGQLPGQQQMAGACGPRIETQRNGFLQKILQRLKVG
jgi:hypothetical protein